MLPRLLMNPGVLFKENRFPQCNDMVFYIYAFIKPETIFLYTLNKRSKGFKFR